MIQVQAPILVVSYNLTSYTALGKRNVMLTVSV